MVPATAVAQLVPSGSEFQVNSYTLDSQSYPNGPLLGSSSNGGFVVAWQDYPGYSISGRRFDSTGAPVGTDFQLVSDNHYDPALAVAPGGAFLLLWEQLDADLTGVYAQRFDSSGAALGTELQVNTYETGFQTRAAAATDSAGNVLVVWNSRVQDGRDYGVFAQAFDASGTPVGSEFQVNVYTAGNEIAPVITAFPAGGFVVSWSSYRFDGVLPNLFARRLDSAAAPIGDEFQLNTYTTCSSGPTALGVAPNGEFAAVWRCFDRDGDQAGIFGQRFSSSGTLIGTDFQVNTHTLSGQTNPQIAHDELGGFAVIWASEPDSFDIFGQRFTSSGGLSGAEFQVNTSTLPYLGFHRIAPLPDGGVVVVWRSDGQDGDAAGLFGQRLAPAGTPLTGKKLLIKNPTAGAAKNKLVLLSKDVAVATPQDVVGDPRCPPFGSGTVTAGATLHVAGEGGDVTIDLPCGGWVADANRTKFSYRDATGATCKKVLVRAGRVLKAVCVGPQITYALGTAQEDVGASLTLGNPGSPSKFCMSFGAATGADVSKDGSNGRVYKARNASAPTFCP